MSHISRLFLTLAKEEIKNEEFDFFFPHKSMLSHLKLRSENESNMKI